MRVLLIAILVCGSVAKADIFDQWAQDHNAASHPRTFLSASVAKLPVPSGHMEIAKRHWFGRSGWALAIYGQGDGRILPLYIAADINNAGQATFIAWTQEAPRKGFAQWGQAADVGTTGVGLAAGLSEANPLLGSSPALIAAAGIKLAAVPALRMHSIEWCYYGLGPIGSLGWGAAGYNALLLSGIATGGIAPVMVGVAAAVATWPDDAERFWACVPSA